MRLRSTIVAVALALAGCGDAYPDYNYKMTIYIDTSDGEKAYSSVRSVEVSETSSIVDSAGTRQTSDLEGEAVIIDHPNGRTYYALLNRVGNLDFAKFVPSYAFEPYLGVYEPLSRGGAGEAKQRSEERYRRMISLEGPRPLPRTMPDRDRHRGDGERQTWPSFVTFDDPSRPESVREVTPDSLRVRRITIEITDEDPTSGIEQRLPWLDEYYDKMLDGARLHDGTPFANNLSTADFRSGS